VHDALLVSILDSIALKAATSDCSANRSLSAGVSVTVNLPLPRTQQNSS
jgi:hypothetical protein